jgi:uncharacterized membrane protein YphA (DoxX/SURF4 family)
MTSPPNPTPTRAPSLIRAIAYWVTTLLVVFLLGGAGAQAILRDPGIVKAVTNLGYPVYFCVLLGVWEVLGGVALLLPGTPLLKEWAYAGIFFDLIAAAVSHFEVGDPAGKIATPLVIGLIAAASWALRPQSRRLAGRLL